MEPPGRGGTHPSPDELVLHGQPVLHRLVGLWGGGKADPCLPPHRLSYVVSTWEKGGRPVRAGWEGAGVNKRGRGYQDQRNTQPHARVALPHQDV